MRRMSILGLMAGSFLFVASPSAQETAGAVQEQRTELTSTGTGSVQEQARRWGITVEDYSRYQEAMAGPRGRFSGPNITPIEVLGIEATTAAERERYAELWVETIRADTTKVLAFSRTVAETWQRLHGNDPLIDRSYINAQRLKQGERPIPSDDYSSILEDPTTVSSSDQLLIFTEVGCETCSSDVLRLIDQLETGAFAGLDIYLLDVPNGDVAAIQGWAASLAIPPELVQTRTLTLNFDGGAYRTITDSLQFTPARFPVVMRRQGDSYDLVSLR